MLTIYDFRSKTSSIFFNMVVLEKNRFYHISLGVINVSLRSRHVLKFSFLSDLSQRGNVCVNERKREKGREKEREGGVKTSFQEDPPFAKWLSYD